MDCPVGVMPKIAELIQADYDEKWFVDPSIRTVSTDVMTKIKDGLSPFKAEVASYITAGFSVDDRYKEEIDMLSRLSEKNLAGVITQIMITLLKIILMAIQCMLGKKNSYFLQYKVSLKYLRFMVLLKTLRA